MKRLLVLFAILLPSILLANSRTILLWLCGAAICALSMLALVVLLFTSAQVRV